MSLHAARLSLLGVILALIAGCGGSSSGMSGGGGNGGGNGGGGNGGGGSSAVTVQFVAGLPSVTALKIGTGNYTLQTVTNGALTFTVPAGTTTYSLAYLCPSNQFGPQIYWYEYILFESTNDATSHQSGECAADFPSESTDLLTVAFAPGAFAGEAAEVGVTAISPGEAPQVGISGINQTPFQMAAPTGNDRVMVGLYDSNVNTHLLAIENFDNQTVPGSLNGGNTVTFVAADAPTPQPITYANVPQGYSVPQTSVSSEPYEESLDRGNLTQYPQLPAAVWHSGDFYHFESSVSQTTGSITLTAGTATYPTTGGPVTLTFPTAWTTAGPTAGALPTLQFDYEGFTNKPDLVASGAFSWNPTATTYIFMAVIATGNYLNGATTLAVPDLSAVGSFLAPPASGVSVTWNEEIDQATFAPLASSRSGGTESYVTATGTYTVP